MTSRAKIVAYLALLSAVVALRPLHAQESSREEVAGQWDISFGQRFESLSEGTRGELAELSLLIQQELVLVCDSESRCHDGAVRGETVRFAVGVSQGRAEFEGRLSGDAFNGTARLPGGVRLEWIGMWRTRTWYCGNHNDPRHSATGREEMERLFAEHGCENWRLN